MSQFKIKITDAAASIKSILKINHIDNNISNLICVLNTMTGTEGIYYKKILLVNLKNNIVKISKYLYDKNQPIEGISLLIRSGNQYTYVKIEPYNVEINTIYEELLDVQKRKYNDEKKHQNNQHLTKKNQKIDPKDVILTTLTGVIVIGFFVFIFYGILLKISVTFLPFLYTEEFRRNYISEQREYREKIELELRQKERKRQLELEREQIQRQHQYEEERKRDIKESLDKACEYKSNQKTPFFCRDREKYD